MLFDCSSCNPVFATAADVVLAAVLCGEGERVKEEETESGEERLGKGEGEEVEEEGVG